MAPRLPVMPQHLVDRLRMVRVADREARLIFLRELAEKPPLFLPPIWHRAPESVKDECRKRAENA